MRHFRYTPEQVAKAVTQADGVLNAAGRALGCTGATVGRYVRRFDIVREAYDEARAQLVGEAEVQLIDAVDEGKWTAVRFTLETLGKSYGFGASPEPANGLDARNLRAEMEKTITRVYLSGDASPRSNAEEVPPDGH